MSFGIVLFAVVFTCTWSNLRLVRGPAALRKPIWQLHSMGRPLITDVYRTPQPSLDQLALPIGRSIPVQVISSPSKSLEVTVVRPSWQRYIAIKS